ncbi:MAG: transcriptional repressor NrdR, partial [Acidimicrobiales bacterium]|nr:transcriptional repressor NrdR [Acidimicrobiales bacterium]
MERGDPRIRVGRVRCPRCSNLDDKVVDSRSADDGSAIRRRRECLACGQRFTTYERVEEVPFVVTKRSGQREPFDRAKVTAGIEAAAKNRPVSPGTISAMASDVEESLRLSGPEITSAEVGRAVLERLQAIDEVAYLRFASVYKDFSGAGDFEREAGLLKSTQPKSG